MIVPIGETTKNHPKDACAAGNTGTLHILEVVITMDEIAIAVETSSP